jgi:hypothetical protein
MSSRPDSATSDLDREINRRLDQVLNSAEMSPYAQQRSAITDLVQEDLTQLREATSTRYRALSDLRSDYAALLARENRRRRRLRALVVLGSVPFICLVLLALAELLWKDPTPFTFPKPLNWGRKTVELYALLFSIISLIGLAIAYQWFSEDQPPTVEASRVVRTTEIAFDERLKADVQEIVRRAISTLLRDSDSIVFSLHAPALVELTSSQIVPSTALDEVRQFIDDHTSSALGIAGVRGIGKSTIIRSVVELDANDRQSRSLGILVSAPVRYDPQALVRYIVEEFTLTALGGARFSSAGAFRGRMFTPRIVGAAVGAYVGVGLLIAGSLSTLPTVNVAQVTGGLIMLGSLALLVFEMSRRYDARRRVSSQSVWRASGPGESSQAIDVLEEGLAALRWQVERGLADKATLKVLSGYFETETAQTRTEREREQTRPELASAFRRLVRDYLAQSRRHDRVVIGVDELDKVGTASDALQIVNEIKDMMHVPGVHFVVSVSEDALQSFSLRGVPVRDAIDSTFDEVIAIRRLNVDESLAILAARAAAFPPPLAAFCHAWSGGVTRDLLRTARQCVAAQRDGGGQATVGSVVRAVVWADATSATSAFLMRSGDMRRLTPGARAEITAILSGPSDLIALAGWMARLDAESTPAPARLSFGEYLRLAEKAYAEFGCEKRYGEWLSEVDDGTLTELAESFARRVADLGTVQ